MSQNHKQAPSAAPAAHHDAHHDAPHEGPIRTPRQLVIWVLLSFVIPIVAIILIAHFVAFGDRTGAGSTGSAEKTIAQRLAPIGKVEVRDPASTPLRNGDQVYAAQCAACHAAGAAGAPKLGDKAAWAARLSTGYEALLNSALKGKGAMAAQGGGDFSDVEIARAVVHMANEGGGKFAVPGPAAAAPAAASAPK